MTGTGRAVSLRRMVTDDLPLARRWLAQPHVARWWSEPIDEQLADFVRALDGRDPTDLAIAIVDATPVGLVQWYSWGDYPEEAEYGALPGEVGIDYLIGSPDHVGRGVGTAIIAATVDEVRRHHPLAGILVSVDATNAASRRVLEKNGFVLVDERDLPGEPEPLSALYRLPADPP